MAGPKTYIGVNGTARQVKNIYVGVNNIARKVKKVYVGVNNVARLVYSSDWWLPTGITQSDVIGAWNFKTTNGGFVAIGNSSHSSSGWYVSPALNYSMASGTLFAAFKYSGLSTANNVDFSAANSVYMVGAFKSFEYFHNGEWKTRDVGGNPATNLWWQANNKIEYYLGNSALPASGVAAFDYANHAIYSNGVSIGVTYKSYNVENIRGIPLAGTYRYPIGGGKCNCTISAAVFYNKALTSAQQSELYSRMAEL